MYDSECVAAWSERSLLDLADWKNGLAFKAIDFATTGRPILKIAELKSGVNASTGRTASDYDPGVFVTSGDLLFSWSGNPDTSIDVFRWYGEDGWLNQHIYKVTPKPEVTNEFLFFLLKALKPRFAAIARNKQTTGLGHVTKGDMERMKIGLPSVDEQAAINSILTPIQDKIELNRRINETLEAQARALFRDWFVDFGPVKAKMAGDAPHLAPELWSLFPDRINDAGVPEGWRYSTIGAEVDAVGGSTPSTKNADFWDGGIAWATPKDLSGLNAPVLLETSRRITSAGLDKISSGLLPVGTVLLSSRAPVGYLAVTQIPLAVNQGYIAMKCERRISNWFAFLWAKQNMDLVLQNANGSTFQEISKKNFRPLPVIVANDDIHREFDRLAEPLFAKITANELENRTLAQTRDLLLPKLMSGEIRVGEAEAQLAEAV